MFEMFGYFFRVQSQKFTSIFPLENGLLRTSGMLNVPSSSPTMYSNSLKLKRGTKKEKVLSEKNI